MKRFFYFIVATFIFSSALRAQDAYHSIDTLRNESLANATWRGYALFCDEANDTLLVFTRDYAAYANNAIPHSVRALRGIVQHGKHRNGREYYQLKMRYAEDCTTY